MREWLTVIVVLLIVGILLDGWRRMRQSRQGVLKMSRSMQEGTDKEEVEEYGSELPNGGARVVAQRDERDIEQMNRNLRDSLDAGRTTAGFTPRPKADPEPIVEPAREPEQVSLNLEESVPMLMEVDQASSELETEILDNNTPGLQETEATQESEPADSAEPWEFKSSAESADQRVEPVISAPATAPSAPETAVKPASEPTMGLDDAEEVIVINVMAPQGQRFPGQLLLDVILECGLRFGDMHIFHRHLDTEGEGPMLFSMANMVKPGTFDLNTMADFETPGVSLFMTLPIAADSRQAFDWMVATADAICTNLGGELKDENRSVMTKQTLEHCRQRISDFERKRLSRV